MRTTRGGYRVNKDLDIMHKQAEEAFLVTTHSILVVLRAFAASLFVLCSASMSRRFYVQEVFPVSFLFMRWLMY